MKQGLPKPPNLQGYELRDDGVFWPQGWVENQCPYNPPGVVCSREGGCGEILTDWWEERLRATKACPHARGRRESMDEGREAEEAGFGNMKGVGR